LGFGIWDLGVRNIEHEIAVRLTPYHPCHSGECQNPVLTLQTLDSSMRWNDTTSVPAKP